MPNQRQRANSELNESALKGLLTEALKESQPSSMQSVACKLGVPIRTLRRRFPEICKKISLRYFSYRDALKENNVEAACAEVRSVAFQLYQEGLDPTRSRVSKRLTKPAYFREPTVISALEAARQELGLNPQ